MNPLIILAAATAPFTYWKCEADKIYDRPEQCVQVEAPKCLDPTKLQCEQIYEGTFEKAWREHFNPSPEERHRRQNVCRSKLAEAHISGQFGAHQFMERCESNAKEP